MNKLEKKERILSLVIVIAVVLGAILIFLSLLQLGFFDKKEVFFSPIEIGSCSVLDQEDSVYRQILDINVTPQISALTEDGVIIHPANDCIRIYARNVTYDCQGNSIGGYLAASSGIYSNASDTRILNCSVSMNPIHSESIGIELDGADNAFVSGNNLINQRTGFVASNSDNFSFVNNLLSDNFNQIILSSGSEGGLISDNEIVNSSELSSSIVNSISDSLEWDFSGVKGLGEGGYGIIVSDATNNIFRDNFLQDNSGGVHFHFSSGNEFRDNIVLDSRRGAVVFFSSFDDLIIDNEIMGTDPSYVDFLVSSGSDISGTSFLNSSLGSYSFGISGGEFAFENQFGKIRFLESVTGSGTNLSDDVRIENNLATVESDVNPGLNISANVSLFNLNNNYFSPVVLRNGEECGAVCYNFSDLNSVSVDFNVSYWTNYSIGEGLEFTEVSSCGVDLDLPGLYIVTQDLVQGSEGVCINITADNVFVDGADREITGTNSNTIGVLIEDAQGSSVRDLKVVGLDDAFVIDSGSDNLLENVTAFNSNSSGVLLAGLSDGNVILDSNLSGSLFGITFSGSASGNYINSTLIENSETGVFFSASSGKTDNVFTQVIVQNSSIGGDLFINAAGSADRTFLIDSYIENYFVGGNVLYFRDSDNGEIRFLDAFDAAASGANLSNDIRIENNLVSVESDSNPGLNRSANVSLFNVPSFEDPVVLRDGEECGSSCYNFTALDASDVVFNVSYWTNYSVGSNETDDDSGSENGNNGGSGGSGGGGGGSGGGSGGGGPLLAFEVNRNLIDVEISLGESLIESLVVENIGNGFLNFDSDVSESVGSYLSLSEGSFDLASGELIALDVEIFFPEDEEIGLYTGNINFKAGNLNKTVNVLLNVVDERVLFDLSSELADDTLTGTQPINADISITDISGLGLVNVFLEYFVADFSGNEVKLSEESLDIDGTASFSRSFDIPEGLEAGDYAFYARLNYGGSSVVASNTFTLLNGNIYLILIIILILVLLIFVFYIILLLRRRDNEKKKKGRRVVLLRGSDRENKSKIAKRYIRDMIKKK